MALEENAKRLGELLSRCGTDAALKERFLSEPKAVLAENGIEMSDAELAAVAGGADLIRALNSAEYSMLTGGGAGGGGMAPVLPHRPGTN